MRDLVKAQRPVYSWIGVEISVAPFVESSDALHESRVSSVLLPQVASGEFQGKQPREFYSPFYYFSYIVLREVSPAASVGRLLMLPIAWVRSEGRQQTSLGSIGCLVGWRWEVVSHCCTCWVVVLVVVLVPQSCYMCSVLVVIVIVRGYLYPRSYWFGIAFCNKIPKISVGSEMCHDASGQHSWLCTQKY